MKLFHITAGIILIVASFYLGIISESLKFPNDCVAFAFVYFILGILNLCIANRKSNE
jgi:hypothetical protein